jgi:hypothetical protein
MYYVIDTLATLMTAATVMMAVAFVLMPVL